MLRTPIHWSERDTHGPRRDAVTMGTLAADAYLRETEVGGSSLVTCDRLGDGLKTESLRTENGSGHDEITTKTRSIIAKG